MAEEDAVVDEDMDDLDAENQDAPKKKGGKLWIVIILIILLTGGGGAAWYFLMGSEPEPVEGEEATEAVNTSKPNYLELNPNFVVNLDDPDLMRYLQVDIQLMSYDASVLSDAEAFMPEVRNRLLLLLAQQKFEQLVSREGKETLQKSALDEVNAVLRENGKADGVNALYFTSFVMQ